MVERAKGNGDLYYTQPRGAVEPRQEREIISWDEVWGHVDRKIEAAIVGLRDATGEVFGIEREQLRGEFAKAVGELKAAQAAELRELRSEISLLRRELAQTKALQEIQREARARDVSLVHMQHEMRELIDRVAPIVQRFGHLP
jgi:hypothetical protein